MNELKISSQKILEELSSRFPGKQEFRTAEVKEAAKSLGYTGKDWNPIFDTATKIRRGTYDLSQMIAPVETVVNQPTISNVVAMAPQSVVNSEKNYAKVDSTFVAWGPFADLKKIIQTEMFYPVYISGLSGNGKTFMVEQACAKLNREFIRVQINPETDEDDLIGGFRLINGETVFSKGPVLKAMENGAVLLLDEVDRATNKIMCLQGILEGKPVLVKKTGEIVEPASGFTIIATANTKGKGSEDGRFTAASIIDEAFLERFTVSIDQNYPSQSIEKKIVGKHFEKFGVELSSDVLEFTEKLIDWADIIRKTFFDDGVDEVISTRRLCHIVQTYSIFKDRMKAINMCIARFDDDTKEAFLDLYTKVDSGVQFNESEDFGPKEFDESD
jgi:midasin (ATPase involved in ribosome maturation)